MMKRIAKVVTVIVAVLGIMGNTSGQDRVPLNWGLGDAQSTNGINAVDAWSISRGDKKITVAVIDTGVDYTHADILSNLWRNHGESGVDSYGKLKSSNGIDDDRNGFVDDEIGWDFVDNDSKPFDVHGHGTHISGIIGGSGKARITGVSPNVSLMILKYYDPKASGETNLKNTIKAIHYAVDNGANIINYSAGGPNFSKEEYEAIRKARDKGVLFVSAAGNERQNADVFRYYPASYGLENIISVTAIDPRGTILPSSNFGPMTVHIAAPGKNIISSTPSGNIGPMTGTSQATAFVSGLAALIFAASPKAIDYLAVKKLILENGNQLASLKGVTITGKTVNALRTLSALANGNLAPEKSQKPKVAQQKSTSTSRNNP